MLQNTFQNVSFCRNITIYLETFGGPHHLMNINDYISSIIHLDNAIFIYKNNLNKLNSISEGVIFLSYFTPLSSDFNKYLKAKIALSIEDPLFCLFQAKPMTRSCSLIQTHFTLHSLSFCELFKKSQSIEIRPFYVCPSF